MQVLLALLLWTIPLLADEAIIESAQAVRQADGTWRAAVTLRHAETGWDDYADGWRVESGDGAILGNRPLLHPHASEQPFTRSLTGVRIPIGTTSVIVRARTSVEGWGEETREVRLVRR